MIDRTPVRLPATRPLVGQLLYIVVTLFHADGDANNHAAPVGCAMKLRREPLQLSGHSNTVCRSSS